MKAVILAGGFAKRMWPTTKEFPKPLLKVGGKPVIEHVLGKVEEVGEIDEVYILINEKFEPQFSKWLRGFLSRLDVELVVEPVKSEEEKLGSMGALGYFLEKKGADDDLMVIAGDNLFEFQLEDLVMFFRDKKSLVFGLYDIRDVSKATGLGVVEINKDGKVTSFEEKPEKPKSTLVATCIYIYPKGFLELVSEYLKLSKLHDAPGYFLKWLYRRKDIYGFVFREKWYDVGTHESLGEAEKDFG